VIGKNNLSIRIVSKTAKQLDVIIHWRKPVVTGIEKREPQSDSIEMKRIYDFKNQFNPFRVAEFIFQFTTRFTCGYSNYTPLG